MSVNNINSSASIDYGTIASGKRINSASDDASGLAISNKLKSQSSGLTAGAENAKSGSNALNIADGAMAGITDYLQKIRELSVSASSGLKSADDLSSIQSEIEQYMKGIQQTADGTEYNTKKLLNGSMADMSIATNPDGSGMSIKMANSTLETLGIDGYNVTGNFDISTIDNALDMVSSARSQGGSFTNALQYAYNSNSNAAIQQTASQSKLEDLDIPKAISEQKKNEVIDDYKTMMQKLQSDNEESIVTKLLQ